MLNALTSIVGEKTTKGFCLAVHHRTRSHTAGRCMGVKHGRHQYRQLWFHLEVYWKMEVQWK